MFDNSVSLHGKKCLALFLGLGLLFSDNVSLYHRKALLDQNNERTATEGKFLLYSNDDESVLLETEFNSHCFEAYYILREKFLGIPPGPKFCNFDELCECGYFYPDKNIVVYSDGKLIKQGRTEKTTLESCGDQNTDLNVNISFIDGLYSSNIGPYEDGEYFVFGKVGNLPMPFFTRTNRITRFKLPSQNLEDAFIMIKYKSPDGWQTHSPVLHFKLMDSPMNGVINWQRVGIIANSELSKRRN